MPDQRYLDLNGHSLFVETRGPETGQPVLLLHHGLGSTRAWKAQISPLAHAGFRVIAYDRWGYGRSEVRHGIDMPGFGDDQSDLLALLDALEIDRAYLVGHSDGGTISLYFAAAHPERVARMAVVAAHIYVEPKMQPSIEVVGAEFEKGEGLALGLARVHGDKYKIAFHNWYDGWRQEHNLSWDMRPVLKKVRCPVLVVQGEDDEHTIPQHAIDLASALPQAELWLLPGARHMLPQEEPDAFNQRLLEFLKREEG